MRKFFVWLSLYAAALALGGCDGQPAATSAGAIGEPSVSDSTACQAFSEEVRDAIPELHPPHQKPFVELRDISSSDLQACETYLGSIGQNDSLAAEHLAQVAFGNRGGTRDLLLAKRYFEMSASIDKNNDYPVEGWAASDEIHLGLIAGSNYCRGDKFNDISASDMRNFPAKLCLPSAETPDQLARTKAICSHFIVARKIEIQKNEKSTYKLYGTNAGRYLAQCMLASLDMGHGVIQVSDSLVFSITPDIMIAAPDPHVITTSAWILANIGPNNSDAELNNDILRRLTPQNKAWADQILTSVMQAKNAQSQRVNQQIQQDLAASQQQPQAEAAQLDAETQQNNQDAAAAMGQIATQGAQQRQAYQNRMEQLHQEYQQYLQSRGYGGGTSGTGGYGTGINGNGGNYAPGGGAPCPIPGQSCIIPGG